ncbi:MAG: dihydroorotase [Ekhidna sp.]|nr:dihydroorotase [Ekhidna sp.]
MSLLLKNALVCDPASPNHNKRCDLLIENGVITSLKGVKAEKEIDLSGYTVFSGWFDLNAHFNDPGNEFKEDLNSGSLAASGGGFTDVQLVPNTNPPLETKSDIKYVLHKKVPLVDLHISAALSEGLEGKNLTEIYDLKFAGASSFTDGDLPVWNAELLLKALQYTQTINSPIFQLAQDVSLSNNTHMHEGKMSTLLGLRGEPGISEELIVMRDIEILRYTGGKIHFSRISSGKSVELIRKAKREGLNVTADTSLHHLIFTDEAVADFDTHMKNLPPFRSESDRKTLIKGVKDGTIDAICSNHRPQDQESKSLEFDLSESGSIALQTFYPSLLKLNNDIPMEILIECITSNPRKLLGIDPVSIDVNMLAKLTIADPEKEWVLDDTTNLSKSRNSPYWGKKLKGKVIGTVNKSSYAFFDD